MVTPVEILSIGLLSVPSVVTVKDPVVAVVLGFCNPLMIIVNGVNKEV